MCRVTHRQYLRNSTLLRSIYSSFLSLAVFTPSVSVDANINAWKAHIYTSTIHTKNQCQCCLELFPYHVCISRLIVRICECTIGITMNPYVSEIDLAIAL